MKVLIDIHTLLSTDINGQRNDNNLSQEKQSDQPLPIVHLSHEHNKEQQILRRIIHNWLGKEINYVQQLEKMDQQVYFFHD